MHTINRRSRGLAVLLATVVIALSITELKASAGHMIGDGDCWRAGTPPN